MKNKKILALALAAVLLVAVGVGGTLAWLADTTEEVKNTFTAAGIDITLEETEGLVDGKWEMQMIPGTSKAKNPVVTVEKATTVDIILFVQFTETVNEDHLTYTSTLTDVNGWTYDEQKKVYYRLVSAESVKTGTVVCDLCTDTDLHWHMLAGDEVEVKNTVTENTTGGEMKWQAWAVQQTGFVTGTTVNDVAAALAAAQADGVVSINP